MNFTKDDKKTIANFIIFAGIVLWCVFNYTLFFEILKFGINLITPVIVGMAIAFIINVPMRSIERKIFKVDKRKHKKLIRVLSLLISIILIIGILVLILFLVIPEFVDALINIAKNMPDSIKWINNLIDKADSIYPELSNYIREIDTKSLVETTIGTTSHIVSGVVGFLSGMVSKLIVAFCGFIISIYILLDKENLVKQTKKLLIALFPKKVEREVVKIFKLTNETFSKFLTGQCLDAILTGFEFFVVLSIIKIPYALILGVLFAVTALIPYIGAFITLVIGAVLVGVVNPIYALWYVIVFFIVQQFDDNFTYPKIVGGKVGLPAIWALIAVLLGGSISGFIGMIISIPIASIIYSLIKDWVNKKVALKEKKKD